MVQGRKKKIIYRSHIQWEDKEKYLFRHIKHWCWRELVSVCVCMSVKTLFHSVKKERAKNKKKKKCHFAYKINEHFMPAHVMDTYYYFCYSCIFSIFIYSFFVVVVAVHHCSFGVAFFRFSMFACIIVFVALVHCCEHAVFLLLLQLLCEST